VAAGEWGIPTEGLDELQTAQAIISALVPEQRQPGSGPMSDADLALFKQSLPRIIGQPEGNKLIIDTMRGIAEYDAEGARIVQKLRNEEMTRAEAFEALMNRKNPLADLGKGGGIGGVAETLSDDVPEGVDPADWQFMTPEEKALFK
jgi:flagellar protein FlgJ